MNLETSTIVKNSPIVEICSQIIKDESKVDREDYRKAVEVIKELASVPNPNNLYELSQLIGFLVDDKVNQITNQYIDFIADVKRVGLSDKALFKKQKGSAFALWQAKGSTAQRYMVGTEYVTLETDEVSVNPAIELEQLQNGQIDFTSVVNDASVAIEHKIIKQIETVLRGYWSTLSSPWYASANGLTAAIDPLITAVARVGSPVILGDIAAIQNFTSLVGFNNNVPDGITVDFHRTGLIGNYKGARIMQLVNPLIGEHDMDTTLLDKGYIYIVPTGVSSESRALKVVFEGDIQSYNTTHVQSRILEIPMYKKVGIGLVSNRYGMALFEDTGL